MPASNPPKAEQEPSESAQEPSESAQEPSEDEQESQAGDSEWTCDVPPPADDATRVLALGTFDILHPGHVHYLSKARRRGDELAVVLARRENVTHKPRPLLSDEQRRAMVAALDPVDYAVIGHPTDHFAPLRSIQPDVLVLGADQHHDESVIESTLAERGFDCEVDRASQKTGDGIYSSSGILQRAFDIRAPTTCHRPPTLRQRPF